MAGHPGEVVPRVGYIVTNSTLSSWEVAAWVVYDDRRWRGYMASLLLLAHDCRLTFGTG